jgi:pilus assembly protein CpaF
MNTTSAYDYLRARLHGRLAASDKPVLDPAEVRNLVENEVEVFQLAAMRRQSDFEPLANPAATVKRLLQDVSGIGNELEELLRDPTIEEIRGNDGDLTYRTTDGQVHQLANPANKQAVLSVCQKLLSKADEQLDSAHPRADAVRIYVATPYGERQARLSASVPPRVDGVISFTLRIPQKRNTTLLDLVGFGSLTEPAATFLEVVVRASRSKTLVTGPPGGGKTTLIEGLLRALPARVRVIVCEENRELNAPLLNGDYWATSKVEDLTDLMRSARVNSPEMIVLGELKGAEAWDLLMGGKFGTAVIAAVHADNTAGAFEGLAMAANPAVPAMSVNSLVDHFSRLFEVVIYCDVAYVTDSDTYLRRVTEIGVVLPQLVSAETGRVAVTPVFQRSSVRAELELVGTELPERLAEECNRVLTNRHLEIEAVLKGAEVRW